MSQVLRSLCIIKKHTYPGIKTFKTEAITTSLYVITTDLFIVIALLHYNYLFITIVLKGS